MSNAITKEDKREKSEFILEQAICLFEHKTFREFTMIELANRCNFSKGIIFKYFRTKEVLFLSMLVKEYNAKLQNTLNMLIEIPDHSIPLKEIKPILLEMMSDDLYTNTTYIQLLLIKCSILEQNLDYNFAKEYETVIHDNFNIVLNLFTRKVEFIGQEVLRNVFTVMDSIIEGYLSKILKPAVINDNIDLLENYLKRVAQLI